MPYFGWLVENLFGFETEKDGNLLLIVGALINNKLIDISPIDKLIIDYLISKLDQSPDLSSPMHAGFELTIQGT